METSSFHEGYESDPEPFLDPSECEAMFGGRVSSYTGVMNSRMHHEPRISEEEASVKKRVLLRKTRERVLTLRDRDGGVWPIKTKIKCFWCRHSFGTEPIGIPVSFKNNKFSLTGNFCSIACAKASECDSYSGVMCGGGASRDRVSVSFMTRKMYGAYADVPKAPHWRALKDYGGDMTIQQFRKLNTLAVKVYLHDGVRPFESVEEYIIYERDVDDSAKETVKSKKQKRSVDGAERERKRNKQKKECPANEDSRGTLPHTNPTSSTLPVVSCSPTTRGVPSIMSLLQRGGK